VSTGIAEALTALIAEALTARSTDRTEGCAKINTESHLSDALYQWTSALDY